MKSKGFIECKHGKVRYWKVIPFERTGHTALFFMRCGGVSKGKYKSLNIGLHTKDDTEKVLANRQLTIEAGKLGPMNPVLANQVHGKVIKQITKKDSNCGWISIKTAIPHTDGLITKVHGLPLGVMTADCLPVLFASEQANAVAAIHAGWRGIANKILLKAVEKLTKSAGIKPNQLQVAIGPAIGPDYFCIQGDVLEKLKLLCPSALVKKANGAFGFDLWEAARIQLLEQGVLKKNLFILRECTAHWSNKYFSYRRDKNTGRMLSVIQINTA